jgi:hypothetical protein
VKKFLESIDQNRAKLSTDPPTRCNADITDGTFSKVLKKFGGSALSGAKVSLIEVNHIPSSAVYPTSHSLFGQKGIMPAMAMIYEH